jgi:hypothetical protein
MKESVYNLKSELVTLGVGNHLLIDCPLLVADRVS